MPLSSVCHTLFSLFCQVAFLAFSMPRCHKPSFFTKRRMCLCASVPHNGTTWKAWPEYFLVVLTLHKERLKPSTAINYSIDAFLMGGTGLTTMQQQGHLIWLRSQWMKVNALMPQERVVGNHRWGPQAEEHTKALCGSKQGQCCGL